jgi:lysocardiolipin and lysophospholipid acyltransferase
MGVYTRLSGLFALLITVSAAIHFFQILSLLIYIFNVKLFKLVNQSGVMLFSRLLLCVVWLYAPCCIVVSGDKGVIADMSKDESVVLVANHQIYLDWVYLWSLAWY